MYLVQWAGLIEANGLVATGENTKKADWRSIPFYSSSAAYPARLSRLSS